MLGNEESDEQLLPSLLVEMGSPSTSLSYGSVPTAGQPSWLASSTTPRWQNRPNSARHSTLLPRRASSRGQAQSTLDQEPPQQSSHLSPSPNIFSAPARPIFASGPPTASVSASLVHASMSSPPPATPSTSSLSAFAGPSSSGIRRLNPPLSHFPLPIGRTVRLRDIEKDTEDPAGPRRSRMGLAPRDDGTPAAVTQLFAAPGPSSPPVSPHPSYIRTASGTQYTRALPAETAPLPSHLYTKGLLSGRHSDITVVAFGTRYPLHRLLLDRAPYFAAALSEPWMESSAKEIKLHPEEVDSNISKAAFELALKRIYGYYNDDDEAKEAMGLFATGCWLDMADLIEASLQSLLKQLRPANVADYIHLVTSNYYGKHGERILAASKAMLCREGWEMPICYFDGISGDIIREIVGCDGFYVPSEWDRYLIAKRLLNRRLRGAALDAGLVDGNGDLLVSKPETARFMAIRFDAIYRRTSEATSAVKIEPGDTWLGLYTSADVASVLVLLDEGIHYIHLSFEQLQRIRESKDALGLPIIPEKVISDALWMSMELRQRIVNAGEKDVELGLAEYLDEPFDDAEEGEGSSQDPVIVSPSDLQGSADIKNEDEEDVESGEASAQPRKFWVPLANATFPLGGDLEAVTPEPAGQNAAYRGRNPPRLLAALDPKDAQWATDFTSSAQDRTEDQPDVANVPSPKLRYTHYPPFRFAVEFPSLKNLKEKRRVYSSTVWYAGSLWNVYVQKRIGPRHTHLGVYLHRERLADPAEGSATIARNDTVREHIDQYEREMAGGRNRRSQPDSRGTHLRDDSVSSDDMAHGTQSVPQNRPSQDLSTLSGLLRSGRGLMKSSEASLNAIDTTSQSNATALDASRLDAERDEEQMKNAYNVPTLPPYFDQRPTTSTFYKIYTPSRSGRVLTVYESGPDTFNFSQSWGWRSSNLILDDAIDASETDSQHKDSRLRFMVVLGNV